MSDSANENQYAAALDHLNLLIKNTHATPAEVFGRLEGHFASYPEGRENLTMVSLLLSSLLPVGPGQAKRAVFYWVKKPSSELDEYLGPFFNEVREIKDSSLLTSGGRCCAEVCLTQEVLDAYHDGSATVLGTGMPITDC